MIRLFVAANFSLSVTRRIAEDVETRRKQVGEALQVAWVPPANYHVTLKFLGSAPEESVEAIAGRLAKIAAQVAPLPMRAHGLGVFPAPERPRVLWVGVDGGAAGGAALGALQQQVERALCELGFPSEDRPFHAHLTVGRVREQRSEVAWTSETDYGTSTVNELVVYESRTHAQGAEYVARARVALGKKENL